MVPNSFTMNSKINFSLQKKPFHRISSLDFMTSELFKCTVICFFILNKCRILIEWTLITAPIPKSTKHSLKSLKKETGLSITYKITSKWCPKSNLTALNKPASLKSYNPSNATWSLKKYKKFLTNRQNRVVMKTISCRSMSCKIRIFSFKSSSCNWTCRFKVTWCSKNKSNKSLRTSKTKLKLTLQTSSKSAPISTSNCKT